MRYAVISTNHDLYYNGSNPFCPGAWILVNNYMNECPFE